MPRVPTGRLKPLSQLLEEVGYAGMTHKASTALDLHDYQYHGPDPSGDLSKCPDRESAARDIMTLTLDIVELVSVHVKRKLEKMWSTEYDQEIENIRKILLEIRSGPP